MTVIGAEYYGLSGPPASALKGITTAGTTRDLFWSDCEWGSHDPAVPDEQRFYWGTADALIKPLLKDGFKRLTVVLRCKHPQYCAPTITPPAPIAAFCYWQASSPPMNATAMHCYGRLCSALARRYPGIAWKIESAQTDPSHWLGPVEAYLDLYDVARASILSADPTATIVMGGVEFGYILDDLRGASLEKIEATIMTRATSDMAKRSLDFGKRMLAAARDVVDCHDLGNGIDPLVRIVRGYAPNAREVWVGDVTSAPPCVYDPTMTVPPANWVTMTKTLAALQKNDAATWKARDAAQVKLTASKIADARALNLARMDFCTVGDLPASPWTAAIAYQGLARADGSRRPVCETIRAAQ